jgi:hypothetical protein
MYKKSLVVFLTVAVLVCGVIGCVMSRTPNPTPEGFQTPMPVGEGWVDLLDASHAADWMNTLDKSDIFEIKDGMLHIYGKSLGKLRYAGYMKERFGDFELHVEFKLTENANSGLFVRSQPGDPVYRGFEIQVLEDKGDPPTKNSCGAVYDVVTPMFNMSRPVGEWNSFDITLRGNEVIIIMNGWTVIHTDLGKMTKPLGKFKVAYSDLPKDGIIAFQDHGGEAWYRNLRIRKL